MPKPRPGRGSRITGGAWLGRRLAPAAQGVRPTTAAMRAALFNWLGNDCTGLRCLDLFAGSGALSLEALSRGAAHATLVEASAPRAAALGRQMRQLAAPASYEVVRAEALKWLQGCSDTWDLVFLDPPYDCDPAKCLQALAERGLLRPAAQVYLERRAASEDAAWPPQLRSVRQRGDASHCQQLLQLA